jgi:hypothetical protein
MVTGTLRIQIMLKDKEFERMIQAEFKNSESNILWQNEDGDYELFGRYRIVSANPGYRVYYSEQEAGVFSSTRIAVSWCIADKYGNYKLAQELLTIDRKLELLKNDIFVRSAVADCSKKAQFREDIGTKLETKIIYKKVLEIELTKCVNWAKYRQQRGFINETARTGRATTNKTSR